MASPTLSDMSTSNAVKLHLYTPAPPRPLTHPLETLHPTPLVPIATYTPHLLDPPHSLDPHTLEPPAARQFWSLFRENDHPVLSNSTR